VVFAYTVGWIVVGSIWYKIAPKATLEHLMRLSAGASEDTRSVSLNETE